MTMWRVTYYDKGREFFISHFPHYWQAKAAAAYTEDGKYRAEIEKVETELTEAKVTPETEGEKQNACNNKRT